MVAVTRSTIIHQWKGRRTSRSRISLAGSRDEIVGNTEPWRWTQPR
jgi:hypothetical protein